MQYKVEKCLQGSNNTIKYKIKIKNELTTINKT